jgi:hypothetical protein
MFANMSLFDKRQLSCIAIEAALRPSLFPTHWTIHWITYFPTHWTIDWTTICTTNWTIDWTTHFPTKRTAHWITHSLTHSLPSYSTTYTPVEHRHYQDANNPPPRTQQHTDITHRRTTSEHTADYDGFTTLRFLQHPVQV